MSFPSARTRLFEHRNCLFCRASWLAQDRASGCSARNVELELLPPEVLMAAGGGALCGSTISARDAWTLGVALYVMLTGP